MSKKATKVVIPAKEQQPKKESLLPTPDLRWIRFEDEKGNKIYIESDPIIESEFYDPTDEWAQREFQFFQESAPDLTPKVFEQQFKGRIIYKAIGGFDAIYKARQANYDGFWAQVTTLDGMLRDRYGIYEAAMTSNGFVNRYRIMNALHNYISKYPRWPMGWPLVKADGKNMDLWDKISWVMKRIWKKFPVAVSPTSLQWLKVIGDRGGVAALLEVERGEVDLTEQYNKYKKEGIRKKNAIQPKPVPPKLTRYEGNGDDETQDDIDTHPSEEMTAIVPETTAETGPIQQQDLIQVSSHLQHDEQQSERKVQEPQPPGEPSEYPALRVTGSIYWCEGMEYFYDHDTLHDPIPEETADTKKWMFHFERRLPNGKVAYFDIVVDK